MAQVFLTSDLHLGHKNLIESHLNMHVDEHLFLLIKNWNSVVKKEDLVYILGDVAMEKYNSCVDIFFRNTKGRKYLIAGNHDNWKLIEKLYKNGFIQKLYGCLSYKGFLLTHCPIDKREIITDEKQICRGNIHGHIHDINRSNLLDPKFYYNVNTQFHDFKPVKFTDIEEHFKTLRNEI